METFNVIAGIASIAGLLFSFLAFKQAKKASTAASHARDAVVLRTLADELEGICLRAEQLVDFLISRRHPEAWLRVSELTSLLSEVRHRRAPYFALDQANSLLTAREQLTSIADVIQQDGGRRRDATADALVIATSRRVATSLREVLGTVKSQLESEITK